MNTTALKPVKMHLDIYGSGDYNGNQKPFPSAYINDALSQNILWYCYEKPQNIEDLAKLCGVPAYYIEERIENLLNRCAVTEPVKGKYQTDFIIFTDKYGQYCEENAKPTLLPVMEKLLPAIRRFFEDTDKIGYYTAEKSSDELHYLCLAMAFYYLSTQYNDVDMAKIPVNYDGNRWRYIAYMESGKYRRIGLGHQLCGQPDDNRHEVFKPCGFGFRMMMFSNYADICCDILNGKVSNNKEAIADIIKRGYAVRRENGEIFVAVPAFSRVQKEMLFKAAVNNFAPFMDEYRAAVEQFIDGYKKLFPKHLEEDAQWQCGGFFAGFYDTITQYCVENGILTAPQEDWICDVLTVVK